MLSICDHELEHHKKKCHTVKSVCDLQDQMPLIAYKVSGSLIVTPKHFIPLSE